MKMKHFVVTLVVMGIMAGAATVWASKPYEGKSITVYVSIAPKHRDLIMEIIAPKLNEKWGIRLIAEEVAAKTMLSKVAVAGDKPTVSVCMWDFPLAMQAVEMGLTAPMKTDLIPNTADLYDYAYYKKEGKIHVLSHGLNAVGIIYNEEIFKKRGLKPPKGWADLWRKDVEGRVSIKALESTYGTGALVAIARWQGGGEDNVQPGFDKLKQLLPNVHTIHTWSSELSKLLQLNEVWIAIEGSYSAPSLKADGFPAAWIAPVEGATMLLSSSSVVKNAPYPDVAHDFINEYYSMEHLLRRAREAGLVSTRKAVWDNLSKEEISRLPLTPGDFGNLVSMDWMKINANRTRWIEMWHREIVK